jgi:anti-sigma-K factor RskA
LKWVCPSSLDPHIIIAFLISQGPASCHLSPRVPISPRVPLSSRLIESHTPKGSWKAGGFWLVVSVVLSVVVAASLLRCSGDVETNPGPPECEYAVVTEGRGTGSMPLPLFSFEVL